MLIGHDVLASMWSPLAVLHSILFQADVPLAVSASGFTFEFIRCPAPKPIIALQLGLDSPCIADMVVRRHLAVARPTISASTHYGFAPSVGSVLHHPNTKNVNVRGILGELHSPRATRRTLPPAVCFSISALPTPRLSRKGVEERT